MKIVEADFITSAFQPSDYPSETVPEAAFAGKSNVGKSSLINCLLNRRNLARTSATPGRTQSINFFSINNRYRFVDLPGYGYARVPKAVQHQWKPMVEAYLRNRRNLKLTVVILDIRREPSALDRDLLEWLAHYHLETMVVLTKIDKLTRNQQSSRQALIKKSLNLPDNSLVLFSALTGEGKDEVWKRLLAALR